MSAGIEDKLAIQELSARYANAMDDDDIDAWMQTWSPNGIWKGRAGTYEGTEQLKRLLPDIRERTKNKRHVMTNFVIDVDGAQAAQCCYLLIFDMTRQTTPTTAVYRDRLKKENGKWLFVERCVTLD